MPERQVYYCLRALGSVEFCGSDAVLSPCQAQMQMTYGSFTIAASTAHSRVFPLPVAFNQIPPQKVQNPPVPGHDVYVISFNHLSADPFLRSMSGKLLEDTPQNRSTCLAYHIYARLAPGNHESEIRIDDSQVGDTLFAHLKPRKVCEL